MVFDYYRELHASILDTYKGVIDQQGGIELSNDWDESYKVEWYICKDGIERGPYTPAELIGQIENRMLRLEDEIRLEGSSHRVKSSELYEHATRLPMGADRNEPLFVLDRAEGTVRFNDGKCGETPKKGINLNSIYRMKPAVVITILSVLTALLITGVFFLIGPYTKGIIPPREPLIEQSDKREGAVDKQTVGHLQNESAAGANLDEKPLIEEKPEENPTVEKLQEEILPEEIPAEERLPEEIPSMEALPERAVNAINNPPEIEGGINDHPAPAGNYITNRSYSFIVNASDPDGDNLVYQWETDGGEILVLNRLGAIEWIAPSSPGIYCITVLIRDGRGGEAFTRREIVVERG